MIEKFLASLMAQAGLSPQHIMQAYQTVMRWQAEIDAFRAGAGNAMQHFSARFDALETELQAQRAMLDDMRRLIVSLTINGVSHHVGSDQHGHGIEQ